MSKPTPGLLAKRKRRALRKSGIRTSDTKAQAVNHHNPELQPNPSKLELWLRSLPTA